MTSHAEYVNDVERPFGVFTDWDLDNLLWKTEDYFTEDHFLQTAGALWQLRYGRHLVCVGRLTRRHNRNCYRCQVQAVSLGRVIELWDKLQVPNP